MADKLIKELEELVSGLIENSDWLEVQEFDVDVTSKKVLVSTVNELEATIRSDNDNTIEAGVALNANGSYNTPAATNYLDTSTSVMNALEILDALITASGELQFASVTIDITNFVTLNSFPLEIVAAQGAGIVIELVSASAYNDYTSQEFISPAGTKLIIKYEPAGDFPPVTTWITEWSEAFIEATSDTCEYGTWTSNLVMLENAALMVGLTENPSVDATYDGVITVWIAYLVRDISGITSISP